MRTIVPFAQGLLSSMRLGFQVRVAALASIVVLVAGPSALVAQEATPGATPALIPTVGETEMLVRLDNAAGEFTEGVTVADDGTVYVSVSPLGQLARVGDDGTHEIVGEVEGLQEGDLGLLGITAHEDGSVYGALFSSNPDANGVWHFDVESGEVGRVPGTEQVTMPNAVAFDADGTMYVTDTIAGAVWVVPPDGTAEPWLEHEMLVGTGDLGMGIPIGANGIAVDVEDGIVYIAVLEQGTLVSIPVAGDGSPGEPAVHVQFEDMALPDGIAIDASGAVYVAHPPINTVTRVTADGEVEVVASGGHLDAPASVAVGPDGDVVYVANYSGALGGLVPPDGAGAGVVIISLAD
jgi:gluconolactonase